VGEKVENRLKGEEGRVNRKYDRGLEVNPEVKNNVIRGEN